MTIALFLYINFNMYLFMYRGHFEWWHYFYIFCLVSKYISMPARRRGTCSVKISWGILYILLKKNWGILYILPKKNWGILYMLPKKNWGIWYMLLKKKWGILHMLLKKKVGDSVHVRFFQFVFFARKLFIGSFYMSMWRHNTLFIVSALPE